MINQTEGQTAQSEYDKKDWVDWHHRGHRHGTYLGIFFVFLGLIFLLNNFNILSWEVWSEIIRFWPLVFIFWGLDIIFGRTIPGKAVVIVVGLLMAAFALAFSVSLTNPDFANWLANQLPWWKTVISVSYNLQY